MDIYQYLPSIDWNEKEVKDAFWKSTVFSVLMTGTMYGIIEYLMTMKSNQKTRLICYAIPTTFSSLKLVYAISIWTSTVVQYLNMGDIEMTDQHIHEMVFKILTQFQDKSQNIVLFSSFIQFLVMDMVIGQDIYLKVLQNRLAKNWSQFLIISIAFVNHDMKWLGFFWLSEYSEVMRYLSLLSGYTHDRIDILIYRMTHVCFQVIYPLFLMYQIHIRQYPISTSLYGILMLSQWYELCLFFIWSIDQMWGIRRNKEMKKE
jgi:hypothetical protein